ncbi:uncharacterized protein DUF2808 [Pseudoduganella flava]|uniref:DUF2808 domain-containing protein n=1 Tax=Pseudoduganella flava TaxID=871742 RepID=A0A562PLG9_9BURK|nr:NBR1-Ig-like domain-containing protein [Pseudoduganella flava]QGZ42331.1 DUF2808 domain-containing protein [Pseudoduganella flava]TWI44886.1 uncharacterized protein DUF2808 [Pseudoduganella flava]
MDGTWKQAVTAVEKQRPLVRNAAFVAQSVPSVMQAGKSYAVSITMRNTGTTNWGWEGYKLGSQVPADSTIWGTGRATLNTSPSEIVLPGQTKTFAFTVTAPSTPGTYPFQWRVLQEGVEWFGTASPLLQVSVVQ